MVKAESRLMHSRCRNDGIPSNQGKTDTSEDHSHGGIFRSSCTKGIWDDVLSFPLFKTSNAPLPGKASVSSLIV